VNEHGIRKRTEIAEHAADKGIQFFAVNVLGNFRHFVLLMGSLAWPIDQAAGGGTIFGRACAL
jgi:hypothetical protein